MQNKIKVSDAMWTTAEAVILMAKRVGITLTITDVYSKETAKELALIANFLIQQVKKGSTQEIEIIKD